MKTTLITTFAFALMVFAFNVSPAFAKEGSDIANKIDNFLFPPSVGTGCVDPKTGSIMEGTTNCEQYHSHNEIDNLEDPDQADNERAVADSGDEGSTSAASTNDQ